MNRDEMHKLLGGYATGTLTPREQDALFAAALEDQELFDALAAEQPLRDLLRDPVVRGHLAATLEEPRQPWYQVWWRPALALGGMAALAILGAVALREKPGTRAVAEVAQVEPAAPKPRPFQPPPPAVAVKQNPVLPLPPKVPARKLEARARPFTAPLPAPPKQEETVAVAALPKPMLARNLARTAPASAAALGAIAGAPASAPARPSAIRYTILRRPAGGEFIAASAGELHQGDEVELRFHPATGGRIIVAAAEEGSPPRVLATGFVAGESEWVTPVLPAGITRVQVTFTPQNTISVSDYVERTAKVSTDAAQPGTVVAGAAGAQTLTFPITLTYR